MASMFADGSAPRGYGRPVNLPKFESSPRQMPQFGGGPPGILPRNCIFELNFNIFSFPK